MISKNRLVHTRRRPWAPQGLIKGSPRVPQELPKTPQGSPKDPQGPPKEHPGSPKETPGTPRDPPAPPNAPLGSPWASLGCPRGSWEPKIRPKWCPRAPKDNAIIKNKIRITEVIRIIMPFSHWTEVWRSYHSFCHQLSNRRTEYARPEQSNDQYTNA